MDSTSERNGKEEIEAKINALQQEKKEVFENHSCRDEAKLAVQSIEQSIRLLQNQKESLKEGGNGVYCKAKTIIEFFDGTKKESTVIVKDHSENSENEEGEIITSKESPLGKAVLKGKEESLVKFNVGEKENHVRILKKT